MSMSFHFLASVCLSLYECHLYVCNSKRRHSLAYIMLVCPLLDTTDPNLSVPDGWAQRMDLGCLGVLDHTAPKGTFS